MSKLISWVKLGLENYKAILSIITLIIGLIGTNLFQHFHAEELLKERDDSNTALTKLSEAVNESTVQDKDVESVTILPQHCKQCNGLKARIEKLEYLHN